MSIWVLLLLFCLQPLLLSYAHKDSSEELGGWAPIIPPMFFHPQPLRDDVVINAGVLGQYRFSEDMHTYNVPSDVQIRPALVDLLNELQVLLNRPMLILSGYHSEQHQIYLWAKWLGDRPEAIKDLNRQGHATWTEWINASQALPGCPSLRSKHRRGDAVNFYCADVEVESDKQRELLTGFIREAGGTREYTVEERTQLNIPSGDNYLLEVTGYGLDEAANIENPSGHPYFHVVYRPSEAPPMPSSHRIGTRMEYPETEHYRYTRGEILLIAVEDYAYFAEVTADTEWQAPDVSIRFFVKDIHERLGNKVSINAIHAKREKPESGWGTQKVFLSYFDGKAWIFSKDVTVFEDHYLLPVSFSGDRRLQFNRVRIPIAQTKKETE